MNGVLNVVAPQGAGEGETEVGSGLKAQGSGKSLELLADRLGSERLSLSPEPEP